MQNKIQAVEDKQKATFKVVVSIAIGIIILIIMIIFLSGKNIKNTSGQSERLRQQNKKLEEQNQSLINTVEKLNTTVVDYRIQDSILMSLSNESYKILPELNNKISHLKKQYEKNTYRYYDSIDVQSYISNEARRIRNEQD